MNWKTFISFCIKNPFSLPKTIWFNFHYLPFKQAIHFPIFCYKIRLRKTKGNIRIISDNMKTGMIQLGKDIVGIYPNNGVTWENTGNVVFRGFTKIGNNCNICIGRNGTLDLGDNFVTNAATKIVCVYSIKIAENARIGWETLLMDTSFHRIKGLDGKLKGKGYGEIILGKNNWLGTKCTVFPGAKTPDYCVIGAGSFLNKDISDLPTHIMVAGNPIQIKVRDVWRDVNDDKPAIIF